MIFPASTTEDGQCFGFPNPCKLQAGPAVVVQPFPSTGMLTDAKAGTCSKKVLIGNKPTVTQASEIARSSGDEAGTLGGVISGRNMDVVTFKVGSEKVLAEGEKVVYLTCTSAHNGSNANVPAGTQVAPSQDKVLVSP